MTRILSVSSSRADVGILTPVWSRLAERSDVELHVLLTGMHCSNASPPVTLPVGAFVHRGGEDLGGDRPAAAARAMRACAEAAAELLDRHDYDCMLLMGDRLDMVPAAFAALP